MVKQILKNDRKLIYSPDKISMQEIFSVAFRSVSTQRGQRNDLILRAKSAINELIKKKGRLSIEEFAKAASYNYSNPQQKFAYKIDFYIPLWNAGLIYEEYNEEKRKRNKA